MSRILAAALSPASVRNVMADLEDMGLIYSPHTSAGRLPTDLGLRFFIDTLMEVGDLSEEERQRIDHEVQGAERRQLGRSRSSRMPARCSPALSRGAGVVLAAKQDMRLKHVEFVRIEPTRALAVLVAENGGVENRIIEIPRGLPTSALIEAANYLNAHFRGRTLAEARADLERQREERRREIDKLTERVIAAGVATWSGATGEPGTLIVRGMSNLIGDVKALEDLERVRLLFDDLESKKDIVQLLGLGRAGRGRAHLHRLGEQALLALRLLARRRAVPRFRRQGGRRARRHRPDAAQLCARRAGGELHGAAGDAAARPLARPRLDFRARKLRYPARETESCDPDHS